MVALKAVNTALIMLYCQSEFDLILFVLSFGLSISAFSSCMVYVCPCTIEQLPWLCTYCVVCLRVQPFVWSYFQTLLEQYVLLQTGTTTAATLQCMAPMASKQSELCLLVSFS